MRCIIKLAKGTGGARGGVWSLSSTQMEAICIHLTATAHLHQTFSYYYFVRFVLSLLFYIDKNIGKNIGVFSIHKKHDLSDINHNHHYS